MQIIHANHSRYTNSFHVFPRPTSLSGSVSLQSNAFSPSHHHHRHPYNMSVQLQFISLFHVYSVFYFQLVP